MTTNASNASPFDIDPNFLDLLAARYMSAASKVVTDDSDAEPVIVKVEVSMSPKPRKGSKNSAKSEESATVCGKGNDARPAPVVAKLSTAGTLDAKGFFKALRNAKDREESIQSIAAFTGYDRAKDYAAQELQAKSEANRQLKAGTVPTTSATLGEHIVRTLHPSTVAGMIVSSHGVALPNPTARQIASLEAKANVVGESIADHTKVADSVDCDPSERHYHTQLANIDRARLATIREDIARLQNARR